MKGGGQAEWKFERKGRDLDAQGRALLEEDLRSPCTEEVAVFHAFSRLVSQARSGFVVLDNESRHALEATARLTPLPAAYPNSTLTVHLQFDY